MLIGFGSRSIKEKTSSGESSRISEFLDVLPRWRESLACPLGYKTKETDVDFFINARTDVFIHVPQDQHDAPLVAQALERAQAYAEAGADGLFVPGLANLALIGDLAKASPLPVNIMVNEGTNIRALATRGVARVSFGAAPYILMMTALKEATQRVILK
jgi:2-methylisocitrate lyase-like PEP mutase family enzyme